MVLSITPIEVASYIETGSKLTNAAATGRLLSFCAILKIDNNLI